MMEAGPDKEQFRIHLAVAEAARRFEANSCKPGLFTKSGRPLALSLINM
jgi:hypothetical protein